MSEAKDFDIDRLTNSWILKPLLSTQF